MKTKIAFLSIVLLALSTSVFAQKQDANATVQAFYKFHLSRSGVFKESEVKAYRKWFSDDLNKLFQTELQREKKYLKKNPTDKPHFGDGLPFQPLDECESGGKLIKNAYTVSAATITEAAAIESSITPSRRPIKSSLVLSPKIRIVGRGRELE